MKTMTFGGLVLILAALFGMVQLGSSMAFARAAADTQTHTKTKFTHPKYRIRTLPGLTGTAHKKAKKKINTSFLKKQQFLGTIAKKDGKYVLTAGIFTYELNDQAQVKKFNGKSVQVTGKLNPQTNEILVKKIEKANG